MIETEAQQLIVDAVKEVDGRALKFNNRFMIGVADLLIKLPLHQPMILEAKLLNLSKKSIAAGHHIADLGCTKLQKDFLRDWHEAGMLTGVVSFIQEHGKGVASLRMALYSYEELMSNQWCGHSTDHHALGDKHERFLNIRERLIGFA